MVKKAAHYKSRRKRARGGGVEASVASGGAHLEAGYLAPAPRLHDVADVEAVMRRVGDLGVDTPTHLLRSVAFEYNHANPKYADFDFYKPINIRDMARAVNEKHFRSRLPSDPHEHPHRPHVGGSVAEDWYRLAGAFGSAAQGFGGAAAAAGGVLTATGVGAEFGVPLALAGGLTVALGTGLGAMKNLGYDAAGQKRGGGILKDVGHHVSNVGKFVRDSGSDVANIAADVFHYTAPIYGDHQTTVRDFSKGVKSINKGFYSGVGTTVNLAGQGLGALDDLF